MSVLLGLSWIAKDVAVSMLAFVRCRPQMLPKLHLLFPDAEAAGWCSLGTETGVLASSMHTDAPWSSPMQTCNCMCKHCINKNVLEESHKSGDSSHRHLCSSCIQIVMRCAQVLRGKSSISVSLAIAHQPSHAVTCAFVQDAL